MGIANDDPLPATLYKALVFPGAQDPAHRMKCRAGHLRHVLAGDREVDLETLFDLLAGLFHQPEQCMGDPSLDLFGRHLHNAYMGVVQPAANSLERTGCNDGKLDTSPGQAADGQTSETLSTTAVAVAG